ASDSELDRIAGQTKEQVFALLKSTVRPEFLNRVDEVIMFRPLNREDIMSIVNLQVDQLKRSLEEREIDFVVAPYALEYLADKGFDPQFGARPVKRMIQKEILNKLSKELIAGNIDKEKPIVMDVFDGEVVFRKPLEMEKSNAGV